METANGVMDVEPLISIIVPVYNAAPHLARCLESIRRQVHKNLEIIVINDGSDDASMHIVKMYAQNDKRIVAVDRENRGVSATRNLGIAMAKGEYLQFVDSDDYVDENATRLLAEKLGQAGADMVISHYCHVDGKRINVYGFLEKDGVLTKESFALGLMEEPASFYYGVMWNKLYKTELVHRHNIQCNEEFTWSEDFLFNLEYIRHARRFIALKTPVYYYVANPKSIVHTQIHPVGAIKSKRRLFEYYKKLYQDMGLYDTYKTQIYKYLVAVSEHI